MTFDPNTTLTRENFGELPPLCTDGAWGTEMEKLGAKPGQMCDTWNVDEPDKVLSVAQAYVDAGAHIVLTNTFNSNRVVLAKHELADRAAELTKAGAEISKQAAAGKAYVFGSIGPVGKIVMMGEVTPEEVEAAGAEQAAALEAGGADAIVVETQSDLLEAKALLAGVLGACSIPVGVSFTYDFGANNDRTMMGVSIPQSYELAQEMEVSFVGANCGSGIETFVNIAAQHAVCGLDIPCWVKGNAGKAEVDAGGRTVYGAGPDVYVNAVAPLLEAGARFIGGCCGSSPEHIKAVAAAMAAA
ncbi:MAG: homocysteine S-methyltransferase family protein [Candidatus Hydrogenedentes bacterium]|jgi:methionine synthase I (cobalamin-dependent)|nr:homocysteine S-methyltransferase family protein [Candidatus Hydrogenedentota bacterium]